jgi:hypothetical protein
MPVDTASGIMQYGCQKANQVQGAETPLLNEHYLIKLMFFLLGFCHRRAVFDENIYKRLINAQQTRDTNISRLPSPLTMADPITSTCTGFKANPAVFGLGVSRYVSNRTSGIY